MTPRGALSDDAREDGLTSNCRKATADLGNTRALYLPEVADADAYSDPCGVK